MGGIGMADYMGLKLKHTDSTETGGSSYLVHVGHAMEAIHAGKIDVALVTLAGLPRQASANLAFHSFGPGQLCQQSLLNNRLDGLQGVCRCTQSELPLEDGHG